MIVASFFKGVFLIFVKTFECEICGSVYNDKKDAEQCCREEKVAKLCNVCGKTNSSKIAAINCCSSVKKNFQKKGVV